MRKLLNRLIDSRIVWVICSIIAAVGLWGYVDTLQNSEEKTFVMTLPIVYQGEDQIYELHQLRLASSAKTTFSMRATGTITNLNRIEESAVIVIDLSGIKEAGAAIEADYSVQYPSGISDRNVTVTPVGGKITVEILQMTTKTLSVSIGGGREYHADSSGGVEYVVLEPVLETKEITLEGPVDVVSNISHASVSLSVAEPLTETATFSRNYDLIMQDGSVLPESALTEISVSVKTVNVTIPVKVVKEVPLVIGEYIYGGGVTADNFANYVSVSISPETVKILGDASVLEAIQSISLGTVNLASFAKTYSRTVTLKAPESTEIYTGETEAQVNITISKLQTTELTVSNITCINAAAGYNAVPQTEALNVTVRGSAGALEELEAADVRVVVDLANFGAAEGRFSITDAITVYVDAEGVEALYLDYTVIVELVRH